jgi:AAA+ superfamily predicted ATPase
MLGNDYQIRETINIKTNNNDYKNNKDFDKNLSLDKIVGLESVKEELRYYLDFIKNMTKKNADSEARGIIFFFFPRTKDQGQMGQKHQSQS